MSMAFVCIVTTSGFAEEHPNMKTVKNVCLMRRTIFNSSPTEISCTYKTVFDDSLLTGYTDADDYVLEEGGLAYTFHRTYHYTHDVTYKYEIMQ